MMNYFDEYEKDLNMRIDSLQAQIEQNERIQDRWMAQHGKMHKEIYLKHERLCDEMECLCAIRSIQWV